MSRVGNTPIQIPSGVTVERGTNELVISGPKGSLKVDINPQVLVDISNSAILLKRKSEEKNVKALHGLIRSLIANAIKGVSEGWTKRLELSGVGFRAAGGGNSLTLNIGYSHPIEIKAPEGISFEITDTTKISVSGIDKYLVGQVAANIKKMRVPDVYKGKGIRYEGEYIRKKAGKAGKVGVGAPK